MASCFVSQRVWFLVVLLTVAGEVRAANVFWRNPNGGSFQSAGSWFGSTVPGGNDYARFSLATDPNQVPISYTASFSASPTNLGLVVEDDQVTFDLNSNVYTTTQFDAVTIATTGSARLTVTDGILSVPFQSELAVGAAANRTGTLNVSTGGLIIGSPSLEIGVVGSGNMTISNNGDVITDRTHLGFTSGVNGIATVTGAGSSLTATEMFVGSSGIGTLNISSSGRVDVGSDAWIGNLAGSTGTANVDGANSLWDISGGLRVGNFGTGTLNIQDGGRVNSAEAVVSNRDFVGGGTPGTGVVNVVGINSRWINSGTLRVGAGEGSINVSDGGYVESGDVTLGAIPGVGSSGAINVSGAASKLLIDGDLEIGFATPGSMHISGGVVQNTNAYISGIAQSSVTVEGTSALWTNSGTLSVGMGAPGTLDIRAGARVESATGIITGSQNSNGGSGHVTVDGTDGISSWIVAGGLQVGFQGNVATLEITHGGQVQSSSGTVGIFNPVEATVLVDGVNADGFRSQWIMSGDFTLNPNGDSLTISGGARVENLNANYAALVNVSGPNSLWTNLGNLTATLGSSKLTVSGGGVVESVNGLIRGTVDVTGAGSRWTNSGTLDVGSSFTGTLNITAGGIVQNTTGDIGRASGSLQSTVNVSGSGSQWLNSGDLRVGGQQRGILNITAGGRVQSVNGRIGSGIISDNGAVAVGGSGSLWTMSGGLMLNQGSLAITPGGTVSVAGGIGLQINSALNLQGGTLSTAEIDIASSGGSFSWTSGTLHVGFYHDDLTVPNGGTLAPIELTIIDGDYLQQNGGALEVDTGFITELVSISGAASLGGNLIVKLRSGEFPAFNQLTYCLQAQSVTGAFANVANGQRILTADGRGSFIVNYGPTSAFNRALVVLSNFITNLPGDYNSNGTVDAADYVVWRNNLGSGTSLLNDDTPGVGADDYMRWRTHFGQTAGGSGFSSAAVVPEPMSWILIATGVSAMIPFLNLRSSHRPESR